ncbi:PD-(D/E)XK nuclease family protein [Kineococcus sp. NPDC059986]|uniref:PD-(D/E)XK nuclease family protein n=1 Tax=Kineococcus sp. NPDC059986 TaxID=3155538 RepID=UPI00344F4076
MIELRDLPGHASYSQLDTWLTCGEKYWLQKATTIPNVPSWSLLGGSAVHSLTEELDRALFEQGVVCVEAEIPARFKEHLDRHLQETLQRTGFTEKDIMASGRASKAWPNKENRDWWEQNGPGMVLSWIHWNQTTPWTIWQTPEGEWAIELELEVEFGGGPIKLAIDRVYQWGSWIIVVDIKSGREPVNNFQLGQYASAIEQKFGVRPSHGAYWMARTGEPGQVHSLVDYDQQHIDMTFRKFKQAKEIGLFLPHPSNLCGSCGVREFCSAKGNRAKEIPRSYMEV